MLEGAKNRSWDFWFSRLWKEEITPSRRSKIHMLHCGQVNMTDAGHSSWKLLFMHLEGSLAVLTNSKPYLFKWLHLATLLEDGFRKRKIIFSITSNTAFLLSERLKQLSAYEPYDKRWETFVLFKGILSIYFQKQLTVGLRRKKKKKIHVEYQCIMSSVLGHCCLGNSAGSIPSHSGLGPVKMTGVVKFSLWFWQYQDENYLIYLLFIYLMLRMLFSHQSLFFSFFDVSKWNFFGDNLKKYKK